jgi:GntR family transcriptional regulator
MPVDRQSSTPLKIQAKKEIQKLILSGELQPGEKLPSERNLQTELDISRTTLRAVLDELQREGMIYSHPGKGRYIAKTILDQQLTHLTGFSQDMLKKGIQPTAKVILQGVEAAQPHLASQLQISPGSNIFKLKRLRFAEKNPVAIEETHITLSLCPEIVNVDFTQASLYDFLSKQGLQPTSAHQVMTAEIATVEEADLLTISYPGSVMRMRRTTFLSNGKPIEFVQSAYSGADFQFTLSLRSGSDFSGEIRQTT